MAISTATRRQAANSALAKIRHDNREEAGRGSNLAPAALGRWLRDKFDLDRKQSFNLWMGIARQALAGHRAASEVDADPRHAIASTSIPRDDSIDRDEGRYRYRVVVRATSTVGRGTTETAFDITSPTNLTGEQLYELAEREFWARWRYDQSARGGTGRGAIHRQNDRPALEFFVIHVGRI